MQSTKPIVNDEGPIIVAIKATLDSCTDPECVKDRRETGYGTCAGGHLARDTVEAVKAVCLDLAGNPITPEEFVCRGLDADKAGIEAIWLTRVRSCLNRWRARFASNPHAHTMLKETRLIEEACDERLTVLSKSI